MRPRKTGREGGKNYELRITNYELGWLPFYAPREGGSGVSPLRVRTGALAFRRLEIFNPKTA
jgi:hypothetical protein